ncbi:MULTISPECIES: BCCT family transporter [Sphingomonas]|jgi:choline/glycine/proline betaine transport protein|uniref:Transporter n=1 Tax=Sphingomonas hankookensis TaxID=563996 RepID=A0ABR5YFT1_9SPHN|nr:MULTISPECIES: BCCT family transporter [Sphingomonas]KZE16094.1 transporter [Sphingomonas hankookensis]PZT90777.1 MAG: BCCT family transporter [Sphingomonas sp.]WCP72706.1 BCCT family transporter [Sphingomonas hankookensis]
MIKSEINSRVFWGASAIIALLLVTTLAMPGTADAAFKAAQNWAIDTFGWFYISAVAVFLVVVLTLGFGPAGKLKLGPDDAEPDFPYLSWLAMLFAAGMGIGLMYFAVAEPIQHYISPPEAPSGTILAAREAMAITFHHYGVHAWAIYALVGLSLAYFTYRKDMPLTLRSGLSPILGKRIDGPLGDAIDIFAVCGTVFGVSTSLGFGVSQMTAGLAYEYGVPDTTTMKIAVIVVVMGAATLSVLSGADRGIRRLSELNLTVAVLLMLFVMAVGPTLFLLRALVQNFGLYLDHFVMRTFTLYAYEPRAWMADWTLFYWAWWIAWSPFVGMFIARISRGRTIREFVIGVLFVPTAFTFLWMTVFGNTAISLDLGVAQGGIADAVQANLSTALFKFLEYLPAAGVTSTLAIALVAIFFVTSADSGALVIDTLASGGAEETPRWQRMYWCVLLGVTATLLLIAGGLGALQSATLLAALPFCFIMLLLAVGLIRQTNADLSGVILPGDTPSISERIKRLLVPARRADILRQMADSGEPALRSVQEAIEKEGWNASEVEQHADSVELTITAADGRPFVYRLTPRSRPLAAYTALDAPESRRSLTWILAAQTNGETGFRDLSGFTADQIASDVLTQMERWRLADTKVQRT